MPRTDQSISICEGDSLVIEDNVYLLTGIYSDTLINFNGCDSIVNTDLLVINHTAFNQSFQLCAGDTLTVDSSLYTSSGDYIDTLVNARGCDSLVYTRVEFIDQIEFMQEADLCPNESFEVGLNLYTASGVYVDTLLAQSGCDSIVTTILGSLVNSEFFQSVEICFGESILVGSNVYDASGNYTDVIESYNGCDSMIQTELIVLENIVYDQNFELCASDSLIVGMSVYQETGTYVDSLISYKGCDSIVNTNLTVLDIEQRFESYNLCEGDTIDLEVGLFFEQGSYPFIIDEEGECDYELIINIESESEEICKIENCKTYIPNIFSPDRDGFNERFKPFSNVVTFKEMIIFDRWGNKLFGSTDSNPVWDGTFQNQKVMPAVYVYLIEGVCKNGDNCLD